MSLRMQARSVEESGARPLGIQRSVPDTDAIASLIAYDKRVPRHDDRLAPRIAVSRSIEPCEAPSPSVTVPMEGPGWCCMTIDEEAEVIDLVRAIHAEENNKAMQLHLLKAV